MCWAAGERARMIVDTLRTRKDAGMEVVGFEPMPSTSEERKEAFRVMLESFRGRTPRIDRVVIALEDRRGELPLRELLEAALRRCRDRGVGSSA